MLVNPEYGFARKFEHAATYEHGKVYCVDNCVAWHVEHRVYETMYYMSMVVIRFSF